MDRPAGQSDEAYTYDANGNRTLSGYATGAGNRLAASPGFTYAYDDEGNLATKTETATGRVTTYAYDHRNRMTGATVRDSLGAVVGQATYTYDALDRRIGTLVDTDGDGPGAPVRTWTAYDGANPYADFDGSGDLQTRYLHGPAVDWLLARTSAAGDTAWYLTDRLGSVRDLADTSGTIINHVAYDAYGRVTGETNPAAGDRFQYTGRELDAVTGLQYNRGRYYDAALGLWTQEDPIGFAAGDPNLRRYVGNSPTNYTDPDGLQAAPPSERSNRFWSLRRYIWTGSGYASDEAYNAAWEGLGENILQNSGKAKSRLDTIAYADPTPASELLSAGLSYAQWKDQQAIEEAAWAVLPGASGKLKNFRKADAVCPPSNQLSGVRSANSTPASSVNAGSALQSKLSALQRAQRTAARTRELPDGRIRYYEAERLASKPGPTRGNAYVTEWDPATGRVRSWMESYDHAGNVTRVHPKMINGQQVIGPHYPPTGQELGR